MAGSSGIGPDSLCFGPLFRHNMMMHILLMTPAPPGSKAGNRATAERWSRLLEASGHRVTVASQYHGESTDMMIALHAWRSREAAGRFKARYPDRPLVVVLTGTDIYQFRQSHPEETNRCINLADVLVGLHRRVADDLPVPCHGKLMTVLQSAEEPLPRQSPAADCFEVCVIGHLRSEKDSLRAALAARLLPAESQICIVQAGRAHDDDWARRAEQESATNQRYRWLGEIDRQAVQQLMSRAQLMVISSIMEGGANVVSEACRSGLPVLASDIAGNRGLLGDDYPGYFRVGDEADLARCLRRAETSGKFLAELRAGVARQAGFFVPAAEQAALIRIVDYARNVTGSIASP